MSEVNKKKLESIAVIPARKNSKRIKNKNIKLFFGKPIIYYSIYNLKKSGLFSKIIVTTDCIKIAKIAKKFGASIDFIRPAYLSNDRIGTLDVINHAVKFLKKKGEIYKYVCCVYPVAPLINPIIFKRCFNILKKFNFNYVFPVSVQQGSNKTFLMLNENKTIKKKIHNLKKKNNVKCYNDTGQYYWGKFEAWIEKRKIFSSKTKVVVLPKNSFVDVNTISDWKILLKLYKNKK
jgi:N-acylneuraminate cytidylyltransferase